MTDLPRGEAYTAAWYRLRASGAETSSRAIAPRIIDLVSPSSVIDVGCGTGQWLAAFVDLGVERICGVDGDWVPRDELAIPSRSFVAADLRHPLPVDDRFDLALSLEVAEHLPEVNASSFVTTLIRLAPVVCFSAAVPGQPGHGHVNAQWPDYWVERFERHGYVPVDAIRPWAWWREEVKYFYRQNTLLFVEARRLPDYPKLDAAHRAAEGPVRAVVHPKLYEVYLRRDIRTRLRPALEVLRRAMRRGRESIRRP